MPYEFLDDIATADVAFKAWGASLEEMFISAADATMNVMVADLDSIERREHRKIEVDSDAIDMLLFALLQEIIFYKDAHLLLLRISRVEIREEGGHFFLAAEASGEVLDASRHDLVVDVKAVTLYRYKVEQTPRGWEAMIVLDI